MSLKINKIKYANMYGPTTGDKIRLGDTDIIIEVEKDYVVYGEEEIRYIKAVLEGNRDHEVKNPEKFSFIKQQLDQIR